MLFCKLWEIVLSLACLIKLSYISVCNRDIYAHVSSASVSNACISIFMVIIIQNMHLEIAVRKFSDNDYRKKKNMHSANTVNAVENYSAKSVNTAGNGWINWQAACMQNR